MPNGPDVGLREYIETIIRLERESGEARWAAHAEVHELIKQALDQSVATLDRRLETMNEFRAQILEERSHYLDKDTYDAKHEELKSKIGLFEQYRANMDGKIWMLGAAMSAGAGLVTILINLAFRYFSK
jgi:hypothetical protein